MSQFNLDIFTPMRIIGKKMSVDALTVPTCKGEIQILPEHTHLMTKLDIGVMRVHQSGKTKEYLVGDGVCKVLGRHILILTKVCEMAGEIDPSMAMENYQKFSKDLYGGGEYIVEERAQLLTSLRLEEARIKMLKKS